MRCLETRYHMFFLISSHATYFFLLRCRDTLSRAMFLFRPKYCEPRYFARLFVLIFVLCKDELHLKVNHHRIHLFSLSIFSVGTLLSFCAILHLFWHCFIQLVCPTKCVFFSAVFLSLASFWTTPPRFLCRNTTEPYSRADPFIK